MRTVKDQSSQFFFKIGPNKATSIWNSPVASPVNSMTFIKEKNSKLQHTRKRNAPPTVDTNLRSAATKSHMKEIPRHGSSVGARQSTPLMDKVSIGKVPGFVMSEIQSSINLGNPGKKFERLRHNVTPGLSNLLKTNTSAAEERTRIVLQPLGQVNGTQLARDRSLNESQDNLKYFLNKRDISNHFDTCDSGTKINETQQSVILPQNQVLPTKIVVRRRETKINKILREIKSNIESGEASQDESREREHQPREQTQKNSFTIKTRSPIIKSPRKNQPQIELIENSHNVIKGSGLPKKFVSYRNVLDSQTLAFNKARAPLLNKSRDQTANTSVELSTSQVVPSFFQNMKANLSARNREVRQKFSKTINFILRKLALLNLTLDDVISKKPFPSEPYEHKGSKALIDAAKIGNVSEMETLLILNVYLVYDFDLLKQTALHWASKRGYTKMMKLLLEKGADPDARDVSGRTPLFLAARASHLNSVKILLYYGANPMIKSNGGRLAIDYAKNDPRIDGLLARGYKLHAFLGTYSSKRFKQTWELMDKYEFQVKEDELE